MVIFVQNIPNDTNAKELKNFFRLALKNWLLKSVGIIDINTLILQDSNGNHIEHHALVTIEPDNLAQEAIKKLDGRQFKGKQTTVRQYFIRDNNQFIYCERRRRLQGSLQY